MSDSNKALKEKLLSSRKNGFDRVDAAELEQMEAQGTILPTARQVLPGNTLYLRIPSDSAISMITPVLQRSPGAVTVVLYIESTGAKLRAPQSLFVSPTQELIHNLSDMLGAKNVVLK